MYIFFCFGRSSLNARNLRNTFTYVATHTQIFDKVIHNVIRCIHWVTIHMVWRCWVVEIASDLFSHWQSNIFVIWMASFTSANEFVSHTFCSCYVCHRVYLSLDLIFVGKYHFDATKAIIMWTQCYLQHKSSNGFSKPICWVIMSNLSFSKFHQNQLKLSQLAFVHPSITQSCIGVPLKKTLHRIECKI